MNATRVRTLFTSVSWALLVNGPFTSKVLAQASIPDQVRTVLFVVSAPDSDHRSYLFGTHHAFGERFFDTLSVARAKLKNCEVLMVESLEPADDVVNARIGSTNWSSYFSRADLVYLRQLFSTSRVDLERLTPAELHAALARHHAMHICGARSPSDTSRTLDAAIAAMADQHGLELVGFETVMDQLEALRADVEGMPRKVHRRRLEAALARIRNGRTSGCTEVERYARQEWDLRLNEPCSNTLMLGDRNARWMVRIEQCIRVQDCFIAVGLSHLMYDCGLIAQLRELGYRVEPVQLGSVDQ